MKKLWRMIPRDVQGAILVVLFMYSMVSVIVGVSVGVRTGPMEKYGATCEANSIHELLNVPYRIACELVKKRW